MGKRNKTRPFPLRKPKSEWFKVIDHQPGVICPLLSLLLLERFSSMCLDCHRGGCPYSISWVEVRNAAKYPTVEKTTPPNNELCALKC